MYWERQRGDLVTFMHSMLFGKQLLTEENFYNYCDEYDSLIKGLNSRNMDGFSEGRCIINYIVELLTRYYTLTIPINVFNNSHEFIDIERYSSLVKNNNIIDYFEFNKNHIWYNKKNIEENQWYKIDSLSGVYKTEPSIRGNNGIILVYRNYQIIFNEMNYFRKLIKQNTDFKKSEIYWCNLNHSIQVIKCYNKSFCNLKNEFSILMKIYRKNEIEKRNSQLKKILGLLHIFPKT